MLRMTPRSPGRAQTGYPGHNRHFLEQHICYFVS